MINLFSGSKITDRGLKALSKLPKLEELCIVYIENISAQVFSFFRKLKKLSYFCSDTILYLNELLKVCEGLEELNFHKDITNGMEGDVKYIFRDIIELLKSHHTNNSIVLKVIFYRSVENSTGRKEKDYKQCVRLSSFKLKEGSDSSLKCEITDMDDVKNYIQEALETHTIYPSYYKIIDEENFEKEIEEKLDHFNSYEPEDGEFSSDDEDIYDDYMWGDDFSDFSYDYDWYPF